MIRQSLLEFIAQLEAASAGLTEPQSVAAMFAPEPDGGYCVYNLLHEFSDAFSYHPGRTEALSPILALARKASLYPDDDVLRMFNEPEWKELVRMRGPVEAIGIRTCTECRNAQAFCYTSGFLDEFAAVCGSCGNMLFQSQYDDRSLPPCECGGSYQRSREACIVCGSGKTNVEQQAGYMYFATHSWTRREISL
jgi:hypothetical protein